MDEDIDKTGYSKVKTEALCKAFKYCCTVSEITIGPEASESITDVECVMKPTSPYSKAFQLKSCKNSPEFPSDFELSLNDRLEERFYAKKLLAELNNACNVDGQKMKFNILKKHEETLERAKEDAEHVRANIESRTLLRKLEIDEKKSSIQNRLIVRQQQLNSSSLSNNAAKKIQELKKQEEEQLREKALQRKKLYDMVYKNEMEFKNAYSEIVAVITNFKDFKQRIASEVELASKINVQFISLIERSKNDSITPAEVEVSSSLLKDILTISSKIKQEKEKYDDELKKKKEKEDEINLKKNLEHVKSPSPSSPPNISNDEKSEKSKYDYMEKYHSVTNYLMEIEQKLKPFITDETLKKYRSDCQKAINLPVNAISPCSAAHLTDKLKKLTTLLNGQHVTVADKRVSATSHPLGIIYCKNLLAEKIVKLGEQVVSSKPDAAFAIAAVTVAIWIEFPDFGKLLLAHFYRRCPYLIPVYWKLEENQTEEEYYKKLGFTYNDGVREELNMFLKRQGGIVRLFASLMITEKKKSLQSQPHPFNLGEGWKFLVAFVKLEPKPEISATILYDVLDVIGSSMLKLYGIQFNKLLHVICKFYLPRIIEATPEGKQGGPLCRLKTFLESIVKGKVLQPPKGLLPSNFW
ncbi:hypothetical protein O3M35_000632 [Rhynocoris fuscipes]|uniref:mRNA export factor GLE1 n=1 Tax=Rhynocoris fuscipes TaxID=488301 RepID=A0AAW1DN20_9HEMI